MDEKFMIIPNILAHEREPCKCNERVRREIEQEQER
jgi:hypothetical protein